MTDTTDAVIGVIPGLLAVGIMANVAGKMINNDRGYKKHKVSKVSRREREDSFW